jgi:S-adenosylhomocysteine hydrolase
MQSQTAKQSSNHNGTVITEISKIIAGENTAAEKDYKVADISLAAWGRREIEIAEKEMPGLMATREKYGPQKPLEDVRVMGSLHMTVQTAVLIETLTALGADVRWASCNIFSTQDHAAAAIAATGTPVFAWKGETLEEYWWCTLKAMTWPDGKTPQLIVDDGGDATLLIHKGYAGENDPALLDTPTDNKELQIVQQLLKKVYQADTAFWHRAAKAWKGVSEETTTGNKDIITAEHMSRMKDQAIVCNIGHFDNEIQVDALNNWPGVEKTQIKPQVDKYTFADGHSIYLLAEGRLVNLGCATGHPSFVMSNSFTNQVLAQMDLWQQKDSREVDVYCLDKKLDEEVARLHLDKLGARLTRMSQEQADYIGVPVDGPYKPDHYRY